MPPPSTRTTYDSSGFAIKTSSPFNTQSVRVSATPAQFPFLHKKTPASHRARGGARTVSLSLGANREGKERIKGKANREPDRVCARVCTTERTTSLAKFPEPTPFVLTTVVMVAVSTSGSTDSRQVLLSCRLNPFLRKKLPASHRAWRGVMEGL